ncbi:endonuclease/exonuclease/phosphatase family protein [Chelonobacter oris]|uniref:endonuclease/exonuclease/phosphatase family protein n=1 Tax=Chelonobacter oris TaxID=505317 RepID=UPI001269D054|nr:endonuclease/exonuclease/phosphatase family protein [Chelonobacter oris]
MMVAVYSHDVAPQHHVTFITRVCAELEYVPKQMMNEIVQAERSTEAHRRYMQLPCLQSIECGHQGTERQLSRHFRIAAWNLERCLDVDASAVLLRRHQPDIVLLSEMDNGMARTQQRHTTQALAKELGMYYLYGVEFLELDLGSEIERTLATDDFNSKGWHGNAILSKVPFKAVAMLRFDDHGHWFGGQKVGDHFGEARIGGRMALLAEVATSQGNVLLVSTHLESNVNQDIHYREQQMLTLAQACRQFKPNLPVIIGGDLNTGNNLADGLDHHAEPLFHSMERLGYHWQANPEGVTTHHSRITLRQQRQQKLDWFCAKDIRCSHGKILSAFAPDGTPLSDHEPILADWVYPKTDRTGI